MRTSAAIVAFAAAALTVADVPTYKSALDMNITDPNTVPLQTRVSWCKGEYNSCRALCDNNPSTNNCDENDLSYECTCASNSSAPGLQYYQQTMPFYICENLYGTCQSTNAGDPQAQGKCDTNIKDLCGKVAPPKIKSSTDDGGDASSTTAQSSSSATQTAKASDSTNTQAAQSTTKSDNIAAPTMVPAAVAAALGLFAYLV